MVEPIMRSVSGTSEKSVLFVEDNVDDVQIVRRVWKRSKIDADLFVVSDGVCAIDFVNKQGDFVSTPVVDLMLLDLKIPKMDGFEVLKILKRIVRNVFFQF